MVAHPQLAAENTAHLHRHLGMAAPTVTALRQTQPHCVSLPSKGGELWLRCAECEGTSAPVDGNTIVPGTGCALCSVDFRSAGRGARPGTFQASARGHASSVTLALLPTRHRASCGF